MNKFFVPNEIYEDRLAICKECVYYFKPTGTCKDCGCFMKIKARLAPIACTQKKWNKTTKIETPEDLPQEIIDEVLKVWVNLKNGKAKDRASKKRMIEIYNVIYATNYSTTTNCSSCIATCFDGIKNLYKKYSQ